MYFANPFKQFKRARGTRAIKGYHDLENHVPYLEMRGRFLVDIYGCVHAMYEVDAPCADVASAERLLAIREQLAGVMDSLPEAIGQLQFIYTNNADYNAVIDQHSQYRSPWEVANVLRDYRVSQLKEELKNRQLIRSTNLLVVSCLPRTNDAGTELLQRFKLSRNGEMKLRTLTLRDVQFQEACQTLLSAEEVLKDHFSQVGIQTFPMQAKQIANYLYHLFNQDLAADCAIPLNFDEERTPINDAWMCHDWHFENGVIQIGDYYHAFVSLNEKPQESRPRLIEAITTGLGFNDVRVTLNVRRLDKNQQMDQLRGHRNRSMSRMREPLQIFDYLKNPKRIEDIRTAEYNVEAKDEITEANVLLSDLRSGKEFLALCQLVVHYWARDREELKRRQQLIVSRFQDMEKARGVSESVAAYHIFRSSLPGSVEPLDRWVKVKGRMAADLVPLQRGFGSQDPPLCLFRNSTGGLVPLDLYSTSGGAKAPIAFVSGATGQGKSYLINQLILQHLVDDPLVIILDIGGSYAPLVSLLKGQYLTFDPQCPFCFNPLQVYAANEQVNGGLAKEPTAAQRMRLCRAIECLVTLPTDPGGQLPEHWIAKIDTALIAVFQQAVSRGQSYVTTTDLFRRLRAYEIQGDVDAKLLADRLQLFVEGGLYGQWTAGPTTINLRHQLLCFDLQGISQDVRLARALVPLIIHYIHDLVMTNRARKKILVFDEMWRFIENPRLMEFIVSAWKTFRKENVLLIGSTQNLRSDIAANPVVAGAVVQSTESWFLLPQGKKEEVDAVVDLLNLTEGQRDILEHLKQTHGTNREGRIESWRELLLLRASNTDLQNSGKLRIQPTSLEHWVATTSPNEVAYRNQVLENTNGNFPNALEILAREYPAGLNLR